MTEPDGRTPPVAGPGAPHPLLERYYASERERRSFVTALFDHTARYYDRVCALGALGSGQRYRRRVLQNAGLRGGMRLLDVATGTGLVARSAIAALGGAAAVIGLDASGGMLREARKSLTVPLVQGRAEELPFGSERFDMLSIGYALRHVNDLGATFREFFRVLKPGGRLVVLEVSRPASRVALHAVRIYLQRGLPLLTRLSTGGRADVGRLTRYYWDTIAECVPPETILDALRRSGFVDVERLVSGGILSEYVGTRPWPSDTAGELRPRADLRGRPG